MKKILPFIILAFSFVSLASAADITLQWDPAEGATGYKLYISTDNGQTWSEGIDVGNVTTYTLTVPDHQLVLIRASAYNNFGESIRTDAGVFYNSDWLAPEKPSGTGVK